MTDSSGANLDARMGGPKAEPHDEASKVGHRQASNK